MAYDSEMSNPPMPIKFIVHLVSNDIKRTCCGDAATSVVDSTSEMFSSHCSTLISTPAAVAAAHSAVDSRLTSSLRQASR